MHRLLQKLDQMRDALEGRVFDVIGEVLSLNDVNLPEMLREAAYDPRRLDEYIEPDRPDRPRPAQEYEQATGIALARANVDFSGFQRRNLEIEEKRLMPRYVEGYFLNAAREVGLRVEPRADGLWRIEHVLADLRSERLQAVRKLGKAESSYRKVTFHKEHLEETAHVDAVLMGPGHPLYAAVDEKLNERLAALRAAWPCTSIQGRRAVSAAFLRDRRPGQGRQGREVPLYGEVVAVREEAGAFEVVPADVLLDLPPHPHPPAAVEPVDPQPAADFLKSTYQLECRNRCQEEREQFARIVREYLERSFTARINRAQERYMGLPGKQRANPSTSWPPTKRSETWPTWSARAKTLAGLDRLEIARTGPVQHVATALVLAAGAEAADQLAALAGEPDTELRKRKEWRPRMRGRRLVAEGFPGERIERVGSQKLGFDIRAHRVRDPATGEIEVRRIEVKGRTRNKPMQLTDSEWRKAQQLRETYWLYVVWDPLTGKDKPLRVHDPAAKLDYAKREIVAIRVFEFPADALAAAALPTG